MVLREKLTVVLRYAVYYVDGIPRAFVVALTDIDENKELFSSYGTAWWHKFMRTNVSLQSYCTTTKLWKLKVVLDYYEAMETYSRIGLLGSYGKLRSYCSSSCSIFGMI